MPFLARDKHQYQSRDRNWHLLKTYFTSTHATNINANFRIKSSLFHCYSVIWILARSNFNFDEKQQKHQQQHTTVSRCHQREDATVECYSASTVLKFQTYYIHEHMCDACSILLSLSTTKARISMFFVIPYPNRS